MVTKYPLLRPAIALAIGIVVASRIPLQWEVGCWLAFTFVLAASFSKAKRNLLLLIFCAFVGASLFSYRYDDRDATDLRRILGVEPELATIAGVLSADPERRVLEQDSATRYRTTARVRIQEIKRGVGWQEASGEVAVSTTGFIPDEYVAGTRVEVSGVIMRPQGPIAPGLFDFERFLKWQRIFFVLRAENTNDWRIIRRVEHSNTAMLYRAFNNWARQTLQRGIPSDENTRLLWAMALGWRPGLTNEISEPFMRTGTLHIFAISGLHIAMIAAILVNALRAFRLSRNWAGGIAIPVIWFYTAATGWQASAIRSTIMSSVIIVGWLLKRPNNLLNSLAASAILIFLWQPEQLFQPGFQLSFILLLSFALWPGMSPNAPWPNPTVYLGQADPEEFERKPDLNAWTRMLARSFEWMTGRDPMLPSDLRPRWRQRLDPFFAWLVGGVNISFASLIGSLPVIAFYFNLISFSSVVANLIIVPASGVALGCSMASLALAWIPYLPEAANWISWETMRFMVWFCRELETVRWTYEYVQTPPLLLIIVYYLSLVAILKRWVQIRIVSPVAIICVGVGLWKETVTTTVTLLPGSGVVFVDAPWAKNDLLIDCGRDREAATIVKPFLRGQGVDRLAAMALTHGDVAHVEGYARLADEFQPAITYTSPARSRSPKYREILRTLEASPDRWRTVAAGDQIAGWRILHPPRGEDFGRADDEVMVLTKRVEGKTILLLSELGRLGQQKIPGAELKCDVAFAGVPNDGRAIRPELLEGMQPKLVVLAGSDAATQRALRELRARATNTLATIEERAIALRGQRGKVVVRTMSGKRVEIP